jgi:surface antigen
MPSIIRGLKLLAALALVSSLGACVTNGPRQEAGTGIGAVAGGVGGALIARNNGMNPVAGAVVGAVAGGIIGNAIGKALDDEERRQLALATQRAANAPVVQNQPPAKVAWKRTDPTTKQVTASGWVVPKTDPYQRADGTTCRDVTQTVEKSGQSQSQDITLCKTQVAQADGSNWVIPQ